MQKLEKFAGLKISFSTFPSEQEGQFYLFTYLFIFLFIYLFIFYLFIFYFFFIYFLFIYYLFFCEYIHQYVFLFENSERSFRENCEDIFTDCKSISTGE
jgi:hypothetical protein